MSSIANGNPDAPTPEATAAGQASGPLMQLLASGLQLWVRQQCDAIESL